MTTDQNRPTIAADPSIGTKEQLLDAAESLIAEQGVDGASVRAITDAAGANLAAVSYHFGSKDGLVQAVFARRLLPINRERLRLLDECTTGVGKPDLERVVRAFVSPPLSILSRDEAPNFGRCMIRALADPGTQMRELMLSMFESIIARFAEALQAALPEHSAAEVFWRFHFMVGSMAYTVGMGHLVEEYSHGVSGTNDFEALNERLVRFICAGMGAPGPEST